MHVSLVVIYVESGAVIHVCGKRGGAQFHDNLKPLKLTSVPQDGF